MIGMHTSGSHSKFRKHSTFAQAAYQYQPRQVSGTSRPRGTDTTQPGGRPSKYIRNVMNMNGAPLEG